MVRLMELSQLRALVTTLQRGSILAASQELGVSAGTLRARLDALEEEVGAALMVRTHRGVEATERGAALVRGATSLLRDADALLESAARGGEDELGVLCTMGPGGSLPPVMGVVVASELRRRHPKLQLRFLSSEDPQRDAGPHVDVLLHFGEPPESGAFRVFVLARFPVHLLASPSYLDARGRPSRVEDLADHDLICWEAPAGDGDAWPLRDGGRFPVRPCISSTDVLRLRALAAAGLGIALLPDAPMARGTIPGEEFEQVLPDLVGREGTLRVMIRETAFGSSRTNAIKRLLRELAEGLFGPVAADWLRAQQEG